MTETLVPKTEDSLSLVTSDLRILVEGSEKRLFIRDKQGNEHRLNPLDISDIIEFEEKLGVSLFQLANSNMGIRHVLFLLYLSLRKEDCNQDDLERRKYKYSERQAQMLFDLKLLPQAVNVFTDLLSISGFASKKEEGTKKEGGPNPP